MQLFNHYYIMKCIFFNTSSIYNYLNLTWNQPLAVPAYYGWSLRQKSRKIQLDVMTKAC